MRIALFSLLLVPALATAQDEAIPQLSYDELREGRGEELEKGEVLEYTTRQGQVLVPGTLLELGVAGGRASSRAEVALSADFSVGSGVENKFFETVYNGSRGAAVAKAVFFGLGGNINPGNYMAPASLQGAAIEVDQIELGGPEKRRAVLVTCTVVDSRYAPNKRGIVTIADIDFALANGEVIDPRYISREDAIAMLEESKRLFDLGVHDKERFEADRQRLTPIILEESREDPASTTDPGNVDATTIEADVRVKATGDAFATSLVEELVASDHDALTLCFARHNQAAEVEFNLTRDGEVDRLEVEGDGSDCVQNVVSQWTTRSLRYVSPVVMTLRAVADPDKARPEPGAPPPPKVEGPKVEIEVAADDPDKQDATTAMEELARDGSSSLGACFPQQPEPQQASAKVTLRMDGTLGRISVEGADEDCLEQALKIWQGTEVAWPAKFVLEISAAWPSDDALVE